MRYIPLNYSGINLHEGRIRPSTIKEDSYSYRYWERALFQRACYALDIKTPDMTQEERALFLYCLFFVGFGAYWNDVEFGKVFNPCTLKGIGFFYQPTSVLITNPAMRGRTGIELKIHEDCELIKLTPDYRGIYDIISYYAFKLSNLDPAIDMSIINNKTPFFAWGKTKAMVQTLKKMFDKVNRGETSVFLGGEHGNVFETDREQGEPFGFIDRPNLKTSYVTDLQLKDMQTLLNSFDREIGIPTIPYQKAERLTSSESESAIVDSQSRVTIWKECLEESFKLVNEKYNTSFSVSFREGGEVVGNYNNDGNEQMDTDV